MQPNLRFITFLPFVRAGALASTRKSRLMPTITSTLRSMASFITQHFGIMSGSTPEKWHRWFVGTEGARDLVRELQGDETVRKLTISTGKLHPKTGQPVDRDEGWDVLGEMLISNTSLTKLVLSGCGIGAVGAGALANGLAQSKALESLDLSNNKMGDAGVFSIANAMPPNKSLKMLSLAGCGFGKMGTTSIAAGCIALNNTLEVLNLENNAIFDGGAIVVAQALEINRSLVTIGLHQCGIGARGQEALASTMYSKIS